MNAKSLLFGVVVMLGLLGCFQATFGNKEDRERVAQERHDRYFNEGRLAREAGAPATANPYIHAGGDVAGDWLRGWSAATSPPSRSP